jgi:16S rRNA (cytosine1402-N4)-methyltransferase
MTKNTTQTVIKQRNLPADYHIPVLYNEALEGLQIKADGVYVDCTYGGGGHSRGILERLGKDGKLVAFDQDEDAAKNLIEDERLVFVPQNFRHIGRFLRLYKIAKVNGILVDLGVSSHQFDEGERGFSTRFDGPLDMRMDQRAEKTALQVLMNYTEPHLQKVFEEFGEVTNAKTLAKHIVQNRPHAGLQTISSFKNLLSPMVKGNPHKYFAQVFQALRMEVNEETEALKELLEQVPEVLEEGGRVAAITFHSIEDRLVKNFFREGSFEETIDKPFERNKKANPLTIITRKPITASEEEIKNNPRSRSAKLRIAEKNMAE